MLILIFYGGEVYSTSEEQRELFSHERDRAFQNLNDNWRLTNFTQ